MAPKSRFIQSVVKSAKNDDVQMPWARGTRRAQTLAARKSAVSIAPARLVRTA